MVRGRTALSTVLCYTAGVALSLIFGSVFTIWLAIAVSVFLLIAGVSDGRAGKSPSALLSDAEPEARYRLMPGITILISFLFLGLFIGSLRLHMLQNSDLADLDSKRATFDVTVTGPLKQKGAKTSFTGRVTGIQRLGDAAAVDEEALVEVFCPESCPDDVAQLEEGSQIRVAAVVGRPVSTPDADFDYGQYLRRRGINAILKASRGQVEVLPAKRGGPQGLVDSLRRHARLSLGTGQWGVAENLLQGMVLGDAHVVSDQIISDFRDSGLLHMLAVSGQNVVLLGFIVTLLLRAMRVPRLVAAVAAAIVICIYVPLTGSGPSIVRAGIVGVLGLAAFVVSRQTDRYHFLALAAALILSLNPYSLLDPGFQLSFASVLAIFYISPVFSAMLSFFPAALREAVAISTATGLVTAPITLENFHQFSLVTVPANVAAAPVAGPVMLLGVLAVLAKPLLPLLAWAIVSVASVLTGYLIAVSRLFASFPDAVYEGGSPGPIAVSAFYLMLAGMVILARKLGARGTIGWLRARPRLTLPLALLLALLVAFAFVHAGSTATPPNVFTVSFLDVGQGDAALIQVPPSETSPDSFAILIDGGPGSDVVKRLEESGVTGLDAVFLTHPDSDHLAGLIPVLNSYPVTAVFDAAPPSSSTMYLDFLKIIEKKGIPYHVARKGQTLAFGDLSMDVLNPGDKIRENDSNANSIVMLARFQALDILFPGDAEGDVLRSLEMPQVELYKVPHHGSSDSAAKAVLDKLRPEAAVISVGTGNRYGHPTEQLLSALREAGARIYRTDRQGTVKASYVDGSVVISTQK